MSTIAERVAAGAAFLDERDPGWARRVDVARLDLSDCEDCVLGQLTGDYDDGLTRFSLLDYTAEKYGFAESAYFASASTSASTSASNYPGLTAEWRRVIRQRRAAS